MGRDLKCCECGYKAHEDTFLEKRGPYHYRYAFIKLKQTPVLSPPLGRAMILNRGLMRLCVESVQEIEKCVTVVMIFARNSLSLKQIMGSGEYALCVLGNHDSC